jgi:hypothetical protein
MAYNKGLNNAGSLGLSNDFQTQLEFNRGVSTRVMKENQASVNKNLDRIRQDIEQANLNYRFGKS